MCTWPDAVACALKGIHWGSVFLKIAISNKLAGIGWNWEWSAIKTKRKWREWSSYVSGWLERRPVRVTQFCNQLLYRSEALLSQRPPARLVASNCNTSLLDDCCGQKRSIVCLWNTCCTRNSNWIWQIYQNLFRVQEMKYNGTGRENVIWTEVINLTNWNEGFPNVVYAVHHIAMYRQTNKMHKLLQMIFIFHCLTLHVSDILPVHHQEHHLVNCITHLVHSCRRV